MHIIDQMMQKCVRAMFVCSIEQNIRIKSDVHAAIPAMIVNACKRGTVSLLFRKHLHHLFTTQISHERWYNLKQLE
jgi:predicted transcriptional regulator